MRKSGGAGGEALRLHPAVSWLWLELHTGPILQKQAAPPVLSGVVKKPTAQHPGLNTQREDYSPSDASYTM